MIVVAATIAAVILKRRNSQALERLGSVLFMEAESVPQLEDVTTVVDEVHPAAPQSVVPGPKEPA